MTCQCGQRATWNFATFETVVDFLQVVHRGPLVRDEYLCPRCLITAMSVLAYTLDRRVIHIYPIKEQHEEELPPIVEEREVKQVDIAEIERRVAKDISSGPKGAR